MAIRNPQDQSLHDQVIDRIASMFNNESFDVYTNKNQEKNYHMDHCYPDVMLTKKKSTTVVFVIEVETEDTINEEEAKQWIEYNRKINATLYVVVPQSKSELLKQICSNVGVIARFGFYSVEKGVLHVRFE